MRSVSGWGRKPDIRATSGRLISLCRNEGRGRSADNKSSSILRWQLPYGKAGTNRNLGAFVDNLWITPARATSRSLRSASNVVPSAEPNAASCTFSGFPQHLENHRHGAREVGGRNSLILLGKADRQQQELVVVEAFCLTLAIRPRLEQLHAFQCRCGQWTGRLTAPERGSRVGKCETSGGAGDESCWGRPCTIWCRGAESNCRHRGFQPRALPLSYPGTEIPF